MKFQKSIFSGEFTVKRMTETDGSLSIAYHLFDNIGRKVANVTVVSDRHEYGCLTGFHIEPDLKERTNNKGLSLATKFLLTVLEDVAIENKDFQHVAAHKWFALFPEAISVLKSLGFESMRGDAPIVICSGADIKTAAKGFIAERDKQKKAPQDQSIFRVEVTTPGNHKIMPKEFLDVLQDIKAFWAKEYDEEYVKELMENCFKLYVARRNEDDQVIGICREITNQETPTKFISLWDAAVRSNYQSIGLEETEQKLNVGKTMMYSVFQEMLKLEGLEDYTFFSFGLPKAIERYRHIIKTHASEVDWYKDHGFVKIPGLPDQEPKPIADYLRVKRQELLHPKAELISHEFGLLKQQFQPETIYKKVDTQNQSIHKI